MERSSRRAAAQHANAGNNHNGNGNSSSNSNSSNSSGTRSSSLTRRRRRDRADSVGKASESESNGYRTSLRSHHAVEEEQQQEEHEDRTVQQAEEEDADEEEEDEAFPSQVSASSASSLLALSGGDKKASGNSNTHNNPRTRAAKAAAKDKHSGHGNGHRARSMSSLSTASASSSHGSDSLVTSEPNDDDDDDDDPSSAKHQNNLRRHQNTPPPHEPAHGDEDEEEDDEELGSGGDHDAEAEPHEEEGDVEDRIAEKLEELAKKQHMVETGTLSEYCRRVGEFKQEKAALLHSAEWHKNLQLKNFHDLYGFEQQKAQDLWKSARQQIKSQLLSQMDAVTKHLENQLSQINAQLASSSSSSSSAREGKPKNKACPALKRPATAVEKGTNTDMDAAARAAIKEQPEVDPAQPVAPEKRSAVRCENGGQPDEPQEEKVKDAMDSEAENKENTENEKKNEDEDVVMEAVEPLQPETAPTEPMQATSEANGQPQNAIVVSTTTAKTTKSNATNAWKRRRIDFSDQLYNVQVPVAKELPVDDMLSDVLEICRERTKTAELTAATKEYEQLEYRLKRLYCGKYIFDEGDEVVISSQYIPEKYVGTISSITDDAVYVKLVTGQKIRLYQQMIQRRRCDLRPLVRGDLAIDSLQTNGWVNCESY